MPIIGAVTGGLDFSNYSAQMTGCRVAAVTSLADAKKTGAVLQLVNFLTSVINFLIIALVLFLAVRAINQLQRKKAEKPAKPPSPTKQEVLQTEIRDILA